MENNVHQFIDYIKSVIQTCEDADRKLLMKKGKIPNPHCPMKDGYASSFNFQYGNKVYGEFEYYDTGGAFGADDEFEYESKNPFPQLFSFLTNEIYENEVVPTLSSWLEEKIQNEPFGGLYRADFQLGILIKGKNYMEFRSGIAVSDPKRKETQREMIRSFVKRKEYEAVDVKSDEYNPVIKDIIYTIPTFFGELSTDMLKEAIVSISKKYKEADSWYFSNAILIPLIGACYNRLEKTVNVNEYGDVESILTDEAISEEELDFLCWIALHIIRNDEDRDDGERLLHLISDKGFSKAKDYLKFGTGEIGKEYTHTKNQKFEAVANDITRAITFKVKEEDAESYSLMLDFIMNLLKQGFPPDYQIKINSKLKNHIPVSGLDKKSKTNLFFGNAASFPELWGKITEYIHAISVEFTYYSDADEEEAVAVGGYATYALGINNLKINAEIVNEFLEKIDFEHDLTARSFVREYMGKEIAKKYGLNY